MRTIVSILCLLALGACTTPGGSATTAQTPVQGAQTLTGQQGQATAAETGSATNQVVPVMVNAFAARRVTVNSGADGSTTVEVEGEPDAEVRVSAANFGNVHMGEATTISASTSSGGGAAGGTGGTSRTDADRWP